MKRFIHLMLTAGSLVCLSLPSFAKECERRAADVYADLEGSVVQVFSASINPYLVSRRYTASTGTGFVFGDEYLVTNYHVVADAEEVVAFQNDEFIGVDVVGIDPTLDIALLEPWVDFPDDASLQPAEPRDTQIGQRVFAIGYPLGIGKTISEGILSGKSRVLPNTTSSWMLPFLQTDAAVSPGNSGGPLVDQCGKLVGMITAGIFEQGAENIGFAIPIEILQPVIQELMEQGYVSRPWHGLYGQMTFPAIFQVMGIPSDKWADTQGFLIETIEPDSAADRAGLRGGSWPMMWGGREVLLGGDIITHVNGQRIDDLETALESVGNLKIGELVEIKFVRDGESHQRRIEINERPILEPELELYRHRN